jgi:NADH-ubiquinone oxidoreductase chain 6
MYNLIITNENIINGYYGNILDIIYIFIIISSILVIIDNNPIKSLLYLIGLFLTISIYLNIIGLTFIGLSYLVIYIGAVSILFLFILMLINIRISELQDDSNNNIPLIIIILTVFYTLLSKLLPYGISTLNQENGLSLKKYENFEILYFITSNS